MQQVSAGSGLQGSQAQGSISSQSTRSVGDPSQGSRVTSSRPKKRERSEPVCDPAKQQRTDKVRRCGEERERPEASSLVGKDGGISSVASVDRLVCIMQYEWNDSAERQLDLVVSRTMLAKVVAITSERECLVKFLMLGGLAILDKWLQEAHRGKHFANKEISQDGEKAVEDLLFALLGALERLPVDLVALKTCPVGKSVNLLRGHKHPDIQRRSKKLVDTWKRRVESEMKQSAEGRLPNDPALNIQQQEGGTIACKTQHPSSNEHSASHEISCGGRGKFASVASLCSSPDGQQLKASSSLVPLPPFADCYVDMPRKVTLTAQLPSQSYNRLPESPCLPRSSSPSSEDGGTKSTVDVVSSAAFAQASSDQVRGSMVTGASRSRKSANVSSSKTSSIAAALSGSVIVSKDSCSNGSEELQGVPARSGATLPCCSSSQMNPQTSLAYDGPSRSSLNSMSSCATDSNNRSSFQPYMCAEPVKAGTQLLANIAASESSMVDVKVSSPSETSAHIDIRICESRAPANALSPRDTTSETSLPTSLGRKDGNRKSGALSSAQQRVHVASEDMKKACLQPAEAVGESSAVNTTESKNTNISFESVGIASRKGDVKERPVFDLNEMLMSEEGVNQASAFSGGVLTMPTQDTFVPGCGSKPALPFTVRAPITVVAAAKGPFTLPSASYLPRGEMGWKGSAPTSAFRPTQPRHALQKPNLHVAEHGVNEKVVMDFDLNVAADAGSADYDMGFSSSSATTAILPSMQGTSAPNFGGSMFSQKASRSPGAAWDLNQVDEGVAETQGRPDFDLNSGPASQDNDDVVLSSKHHGIRAYSISDTTNLGAANRLPSLPLNSGTPIMMPAFAMTNSEFPYTLGAATPWPNSGPHDGMFQYNILLPNQPGMACPPLSSMPTGPYGGIHFGFSPASMQSFSTPFMDTLRGPHTGPLAPPSTTNGERSLSPSQTKTPPFMMGVLADAIQHQGRGGFWSRSSLDLNAGPDGIDAPNAKDDRWQHIVPLNDQMRARHRGMDMAAVSKQREQDGCSSMPGSRQGVPMKQHVWR